MAQSLVSQCNQNMPDNLHGRYLYLDKDLGVDGILDAVTIKLNGTAIGLALAATAAPLDLPLVGARLIADWTTVVATTPGSSLLGLSATVGSVLLGNAASGNTKTDKAQFIFQLPAWYVAGSAITVRLRSKQATTLSTASSKVDVDSFKVNADGAMGSDLCSTAAQQVTTAYANYDFTITPTSRVAGETVVLVVSTIADDTGGTVNTAMSISKVQVLLG